MFHRPAWAPDEVDIETPAAARMYDYYLGGSHNFAADRKLAEETLRIWPDAPYVARANRAFLHRAVTHLAGLGVDQFLDLGSGIPTGGNVHDIAHAINPDARTVYVDVDPVAVAHSRALLADVPYASILHADLRNADAVLADPGVGAFLDLRRPVAVLMVAVLPFVTNEDGPGEVTAAYRDATVPDSYLVLSHGTTDYQPERVRQTENVYTRASHSVTLRSREQILGLTNGYDLEPPGLVDIIYWRPDPTATTTQDPLGGDVTRYSMYATVGRRT